MKTLQTKLHRYYFTIDKPADKAAYEKMVTDNNLRARHEMHCISANRDTSKLTRVNGEHVEPCEIETTHLFGNQWNSATERVFDWYEEIFPSKSCKAGHWLEITPEMEALRTDTKKCGYCGALYGPLHNETPKKGFCTACLDSNYLQEENLYMLRLVSVGADDRGKKYAKLRPTLFPEESAWLLPAYVERQTTGTDSRAKAARDKQRADVVAEFEKDTRTAKMEHDGKLWLWEKGFDLSNWIFYNHTQKFALGWRQPASKAVVSKVLDIISEFPFSYELKCEDGKTYSN